MIEVFSHRDERSVFNTVPECSITECDVKSGVILFVELWVL